MVNGALMFEHFYLAKAPYESRYHESSDVVSLAIPKCCRLPSSKIIANCAG